MLMSAAICMRRGLRGSIRANCFTWSGRHLSLFFLNEPLHTRGVITLLMSECRRAWLTCSDVHLSLIDKLSTPVSRRSLIGPVVVQVVHALAVQLLAHWLLTSHWTLNGKF